MTTFNTQEQLAQLELKFNGPLIKDSQVDTASDLLTLNSTYNYEHKIVWVKDEKRNYYLNSGDGSVASNWQRIANRAVIEKYVPSETYQTSEVVFVNGVLYVATQDVPVGYVPASYPDYWEMLSGESFSQRLLFQNASSVIFHTVITNPFINVYVGDIVYDGENIVIDDETGLVKFENESIVDVPVNRRSDLPDNEGKAYEILFHENEVETEQVSGYIIIK